MTTVREILEQSGLDPYTINSLDPQVTGALQNVLSKAEEDKIERRSILAKHLQSRRRRMGKRTR